MHTARAWMKLIKTRAKMDSKWMKRAILFQPGFRAIFFEIIDKKMNIKPEPENRIGRGFNLINF